MADPRSNPSPSNKTPTYPGGVGTTRRVGGSVKRPSIPVPTGPRDSQDATVAEPGQRRHPTNGQFVSSPFGTPGGE